MSQLLLVLLNRVTPGNAYHSVRSIVTVAHSLAKKTVVQLRPKSATGSSFYWSISGTFVGGYDSSPRKISVSRFCVS